MTPPAGPLTGAALRLAGHGPAVDVAAALLARLGAVLVDRGPAGVLEGGDDEGLPAATSHTAVPAGAVMVPPGTFEVAAAALLAAAAVEAGRSGTDVATSRVEAYEHVLRSLLVDGPDAIRPNPPVLVGDGAVNRDLGPDRDEATYDRLVAAIGTQAGDPELLAVRAQEWRLAVTPYRSLPQAAPPPVELLGDPAAAATASDATDGLVVLDMTAMWAGPLATALLATGTLGRPAHVTKIEPDCRRDGLRDGAPGLAARLDAAKSHAALDLRVPGDRADFFDLVASADLVVDSFSRRVMPNLGLTPAELRQLRPDILTLSLPAFGLGRAEQDWVAYGSGVHATSGLGVGPCGPWAPSVSYPDPLAGLTAHAVARAMLWGRSRGWAPRHAEVSLHGAIGPLLSCAIRP
jgi:CoA-transferase family III